MAKDWFYQANDGEKGPFSGTELKQLAYKGEIVAVTKVRKGAEGRWVSATQVQGLVPTPGTGSPTDTISPAQLPPKETATTKSVVVSKPKPVAESKPAPNASSQPEPESASNSFDPFAAFSNAGASSATDGAPSADPAEDLFGFSDTFSNPSDLKKKIKAAKAVKATESDTTEPKPKRKGMPHKAILVGMGGVLAILLGVAGYLLIFKKDPGSSEPVAKTNPPAATDKDKTESGDKVNATDTNPDIEKTSTKGSDQSPANVVEAAVAKAPAPVEVATKKADPTPNKPYGTEEELFEAAAPTVARIKGRMSGGSGFLLDGNIVVTNKHVVESELIEKLDIYFPSAGREAGPYKAQLLFKDRDRDIAILRVETKLKPTKIVKNYKFRAGQRIMAIGSPGAISDDHFLENAISTGVMSTRTEVDHKKYYQMNIAVNPGNSGGPVFDYYGNVLGVVTLRGPEQESHGYCIPAEEVEDSLKRQKRMKESELAEMISNHRVKAVYSVASLSSRKYLQVMAYYIIKGREFPKTTKVKDIPVPVELRKSLKEINQDLHEDIQKYYDEVMEDKSALSDNLREELKQFWENFQVLKKSAETPEGKIDAYLKKFQEAATKYAELKPKLKAGLGMEYEH